VSYCTDDFAVTAVLQLLEDSTTALRRLLNDDELANDEDTECSLL